MLKNMFQLKIKNGRILLSVSENGSKTYISFPKKNKKELIEVLQDKNSVDKQK